MDKFLQNRQFIFAMVVFVIATLFCWVMKYPGEIYVQLVGLVVLGYLPSQTVKDWIQKGQNGS